VSSLLIATAVEGVVVLGILLAWVLIV